MKMLRKCWVNWCLRRAYAGSSAALNCMYLFKDPWRVDTPGEHIRFEETVSLIRNKIGSHFGSILEVGCGEGVQTRYLSPLTERIIGLDPSPKAIRRAKAKKISNAKFEVGDLMNYQGCETEIFDLVSACEVIYYIQDIERAFEKLNSLGRVCVATYFRGRADHLDKFFAEKKVSSEIIRSPVCEWTIVHWKSESNAQGGS